MGSGESLYHSVPRFGVIFSVVKMGRRQTVRFTYVVLDCASL